MDRLSLARDESQGELSAVVIAAGQASRLRPHSEERPKALMELTPSLTIIDHAIRQFRDVGIDNITVVTRPEYRSVFEHHLNGRARVVVVEGNGFGNLTSLAAGLGAAGSSRVLSKLGPEIVLVTRGVKGTVVWSKKGGAFNVPAYKTDVKDPTGAGDGLAGAFLVSWVRTGDLLWSTAVGSAVASFVVANLGPADFGTPKQIERRAQRILDGTVRIRG